MGTKSRQTNWVHLFSLINLNENYYFIFYRFVTTTRVTHATPAALYSHSTSRYWEDDSKIPEEDRNLCKDIARQLIEDEPGININVTLIRIE